MQLKKNIVLALIALALCVQHYYQGVGLIRHTSAKLYSFHTCTYGSMIKGWKEYKEHVYKPWRSRLFSTGVASAFCKTSGYDHNRHEIQRSGITADGVNEFSGMVSLWNTIWFALALILGVLLVKNKLLYMMALFTFTSFSLSPALGTGEAMIYPWDGPSLFFWTAAMAAAIKYRSALPFIVAVGMGFKETVILFSICPFFWNDIKLSERIKKAAIIAAAAISVKVVLDVIAGNSILFTPITQIREPGGSAMVSLLSQNLKELFTFKSNSVIFSAAVAFAAIFLTTNLPKMNKYLAAAYMPFLLVFCVLSEIRLYHELIPLFFIGGDKP